MTILRFDSPRLRGKAHTVRVHGKELTALIENLTTTVAAQIDPEGVGLAAPQIGIPQRIFVAKLGTRFVPFINPKILEVGREETLGIEGCLSIPDYYGEVRRPRIVTIRFTNRFGRTVTHPYAGNAARIIQHEYDHLDGVLFFDHMKQQGGKFYRYLGKDINGKEVFDEVDPKLIL